MVVAPVNLRDAFCAGWAVRGVKRDQRQRKDGDGAKGSGADDRPHRDGRAMRSPRHL
jgi:hypothetical protein